jgi:signal peptidase II
VKRFFIAAVAVLNLLAADAVAKELAVAKLKGAAALPVVPGFFDLAYVENRGCAWGLLQGHVWPLAAFGALALAVLVWKRRSIFGDLSAGSASAWLGAFAEPLIYAGILGNAIDRVFRGHVVDMLDFHWGASHFPCFNLADVYISVAVGLMLLASLAERNERNRK